MLQCNSVASTLRGQLSSAFELEESEHTCLIHTPFVYPDNTLIALQVERLTDGRYRLSDDGVAHEYAWISGVTNQRLESAAADIETRFHVAASDGHVVKVTEEVSLLQGLMDAVMATRSIAETVVTRPSAGKRSSFRKEIETYLAVNNLTYERDVYVEGKTGKRKVDYRVTSSGATQSFGMFPISDATSQEHAESVAFRVNDIINQESGVLPMRIAILIEDSHRERSGGLSEQWQSILRTVRGTDAETYLWSDKPQIQELLVA